MKSTRIISTALAAAALVAGSAQAMPARDAGFYGSGPSQTVPAKLHEQVAAERSTALALVIRRGPLAV